MMYALRLLLIAAVAWAIYTLFFKKKGRPPAPKKSTQPDRLVSCRHCGLHIPQRIAIPGSTDDEYYCSLEHRHADQR